MSAAFDASTTTQVLALLKSGEGVQLASVGGKWLETLCYRGGQFVIETCDEGASSEATVTEQVALTKLAGVPDAVRELLARPQWKHFAAVFVDGNRDDARAALAATRGLPGAPERYRYVLEAVLAWPDTAPSPEVRAKLIGLVEDGMAVRAFVAATNGREDAATSQRAIDYLSALGEITGWRRFVYEQRAGFHERLGNLQAALDDCLSERKLAPHMSLDERIQKLRTALRRR